MWTADDVGLAIVLLARVFLAAALIRKWSKHLRALFLPTAVIGGFLALVLGPEELSFAGGDGTLAGLGPVFDEYGAGELVAVGLGLATIGLVTGVVVGKWSSAESDAISASSVAAQQSYQGDEPRPANRAVGHHDLASVALRVQSRGQGAGRVPA
jgi:hypothetical protein